MALGQIQTPGASHATPTTTRSTPLTPGAPTQRHSGYRTAAPGFNNSMAGGQARPDRVGSSGPGRTRSLRPLMLDRFEPQPAQAQPTPGLSPTPSAPPPAPPVPYTAPPLATYQSPLGRAVGGNDGGGQFQQRQFPYLAPLTTSAYSPGPNQHSMRGNFAPTPGTNPGAFQPSYQFQNSPMPQSSPSQPSPLPQFNPAPLRPY